MRGLDQRQDGAFQLVHVSFGQTAPWLCIISLVARAAISASGACPAPCAPARPAGAPAEKEPPVPGAARSCLTGAAPPLCVYLGRFCQRNV